MIIGFQDPNYGSKYGSNRIRNQINSRNNSDTADIKKKKHSNNSSSSGKIILATVGTLAAGILALKNKSKLKELFPKIKETGTNAVKTVREKFPNVGEAIKKARTTISEKAKNIFSKKA